MRVTFVDEAGEAASANSAPSKRSRRKRPIRLADAFRSEGLDEHRVARNYADALDKLNAPKPNGKRRASSGAVEKLLLDALKECTRILEPPRPASDRAPDAPAVVKLIHRVPRPRRQADRRTMHSSDEADS